MFVFVFCLCLRFVVEVCVWFFVYYVVRECRFVCCPLWGCFCSFSLCVSGHVVEVCACLFFAMLFVCVVLCLFVSVVLFGVLFVFKVCG